MELLTLKLILTPLLIGVASVAAGRWGPAVGGWIVSLPMISGSVALFVALQDGTGFAALTAAASLAGTIAIAAYCIAYVQVARRARWPAAAFAALLSWAIVAAIVRPLISLPVVLPLLAVALLAFTALRWMPRGSMRPSASSMPRWNLAARMIVGTGAVLGLTTLAPLIGPTATGLLATLPVSTSVLAIFVHAREGATAATGILRGLLTGLLASAVFLALLSGTVRPLGILASFALSLVAVMVLQAVALTQIAAGLQRA